MSNARLAGRLRHMLVVEDSAIIAMDVECSLEDLGVAQVTLVPDLEGALQAIEAGGIDAALVDVFLGREDGLVAARRLAALGISFALMTGLGDAGRLQDEFPGIAILSKPFSGEDLAATVLQLRAAQSR